MAFAAIMVACCNVSNNDYTQFVDPFIGTGGHGHTFPGPVMPHGMIQPSPDTRIDGWDACSGYHYTDSLINGFTQNHLSGTDCADYGDFLLMPTVGEQKIDPQCDSLQNRPFESVFSHADEVATPGYYSTLLKTYGIKAEITAANRAAIYSFTYPETDDAGLILDVDYSIQNQNNTDMKVEILGDVFASVVLTTDSLVVIGGDVTGAMKYIKPALLREMRSTINTIGGETLNRLPLTVFDLDNEEEFRKFALGESRELKVYGSDDTVIYDPMKRTGLAVTSIGASKAISIGAYSYALAQIDARR